MNTQPPVKQMLLGSFVTSYITVPCGDQYVHIWNERPFPFRVKKNKSINEYSFTVTSRPTLYLDDTFSQVVGQDMLSLMSILLLNVVPPCSIRIFDKSLERRFAGILQAYNMEIIKTQESLQFNKPFKRFIIKKGSI